MLHAMVFICLDRPKSHLVYLNNSYNVYEKLTNDTNSDKNRISQCSSSIIPFLPTCSFSDNIS